MKGTNIPIISALFPPFPFDRSSVASRNRPSLVESPCEVARQEAGRLLSLTAAFTTTIDAVDSVLFGAHRCTPSSRVNRQSAIGVFVPFETLLNALTEPVDAR